VNNDTPLESPLHLPRARDLVQNLPKVHKTIESDDRNQSSSYLDLINLNSEEVSLIEQNTSHLNDSPHKETQKDLQELITILGKFES